MTDLAAKFEPLQFRIGPTKSLHGRKNPWKKESANKRTLSSFFREREKCYNCATRAAWNFPDLLFSPLLPSPGFAWRDMKSLRLRFSFNSCGAGGASLHWGIFQRFKGLQEVAMSFPSINFCPFLNAGKGFNFCCCVTLLNCLQEGFCRLSYLLT